MSLVLIVDDAQSVRKMLSLLLKRAGYEVVEASSSEEANSAFVNMRPDAVIADYHLAGTEDGLSLIRQLREQTDGRHVGFALMTADSLESVSVSGICDAVLEKPITLEAAQRFLRQMEV